MTRNFLIFGFVFNTLSFLQVVIFCLSISKLSMLWTNSADDKLMIFFLIFTRK